MKRVRILIADDHALVRAGLRAILEKAPEIELVAEAADGLEAISKIGTSFPDVLLMDIGMGAMNGLDATIRITREYPEVKVIIVSMHANEEYVLRALRAGAAGYIMKNSKPPELLQAIQMVVAGEMYLSPRVSRHVIENYVRSMEMEKSPLEDLTPRQREILKFVAEGRNNREIAAILGVSMKTVDTHRSQLMQRLDIHDIAGLVRFAIKMGLVSLDT
jgi:DNA-binding NarL/FixJ family response regulator